MRTPHLALALLALACSGDDKPEETTPEDTDTTAPIDDTTTDSGSSDTDTEPTGATGLTGDTSDTGDVVPCTSSEQVVGGRLPTLSWTAPSGETVWMRRYGSVVRDAAGVWTDDPAGPPYRALLVDGSAIDEVWSVDDDALWRRDPGTGHWVADPSFPTLSRDAIGLYVDGPGDVTVVTRDPVSHIVRAHTLDGALWSTRPLVTDLDAHRSARLPDGRLLLGLLDELMVETSTGFAPVPIPADMTMSHLHAADDGTVLIVGFSNGDPGAVALGDESGLTAIDPGLPDAVWTYGDLRSASDVWLLGQAGDTPIMVHFDGTEWSEVPLPADTVGYRFALTPTETVLAGGQTYARHAASGDADGLTVELAEPGIESLDRLLIDDVLGTVWALDNQYGSTYDGTSWTPAEHPGRDAVGYLNTGDISDGRGAFFGVDTLWYSDGVDATPTVLPDGETIAAIVGVSGVFYALGADDQGGPVGYRHDGTDWSSVDLSSLPGDVTIESAWGDGVDDVYLGLEVGGPFGTGALAHWDGSTTTVVVPALPHKPRWIQRVVDGTLWLGLFVGGGSGDGVYQWDGVSATQVPSPPDVRAAHLMADGTMHFSIVTSRPNPPDPLVSKVVRVLPDGTETDVLEDEDPISLLGLTDDTVVAAYGGNTVAWTSTCP